MLFRAGGLEVCRVALACFRGTSFLKGFSPRGVIRLTMCCVRGRDNQKSLANSQMLAGFNHKMSKHDMAVQGMRTTDYADMTDEAGED